MRKRPKRYLGLFCGLVAVCLIALYMSATVTRTQAVFDLDFSRDNPLDALSGSNLPIGGGQLSSISTDEKGNFYILGIKKQSLQVVISSKDGIKRTASLRRKDNRPIRYVPPFFSVNSSGAKLWILRTPFEDRKDPQKWELQDKILGVYDLKGKLLQEWKHPASAGASLLQAVGEKQSFIGDETGHIWIYKFGKQVPQRVKYSLTPGDFVTAQGKIWVLQRKPQQLGAASNATPTFTAQVQELNQPAQTIYTFAMPFAEVGQPSIFWHEPGAGLFLFKYLQTSEGVSPDRAKAVYKVSTEGAQILFETQNLLTDRDGMTVKAGRLLKADKEGSIWMEAGYFNGTNLKEYQILKIQSVPRWRTWIK
jgi:hypothetical protein